MNDLFLKEKGKSYLLFEFSEFDNLLMAIRLFVRFNINPNLSIHIKRVERFNSVVYQAFVVPCRKVKVSIL